MLNVEIIKSRFHLTKAIVVLGRWISTVCKILFSCNRKVELTSIASECEPVLGQKKKCKKVKTKKRTD